MLTAASEPVEAAVRSASQEGGSWRRFAALGGPFVAGRGLGLLALVYWERLAEHRRADAMIGLGAASAVEMERRSGLTPARTLALHIAVGIGLRNFAEGLAIGQSAVAGETSLALALIVGFGLRNATEGFGIVAPMAGERTLPSWRFLALLGLIGGGPTFLGTVVGQAWVNDFVSVAFLTLAAGSILYVVVELFSVTAPSASSGSRHGACLSGRLQASSPTGCLSRRAHSRSSR